MVHWKGNCKLLKIHKALMERLTRWTDIDCFLSSDRRGAYLFFFLFEIDKVDNK